MKVIQTFLSDPLADPPSEYWWTQEKYRCFSLALSCMQLVKQYPDVTLITDKKGKELLIDILKLPYHKVDVRLEGRHRNLSTLTHGLAKVFSWSLQDDPFLFVDESVYIWNRIPEPALDGDLFVFNAERNNDDVLKGLTTFESIFSNVPLDILNRSQSKTSYSTRIVGGCANEIFKNYWNYLGELCKDIAVEENFNLAELDPIFQAYLLKHYCDSKTTGVKNLLGFTLDDGQFTPFTVFESVHPAVQLSYIPDGMKSDLNTQASLSLMVQSLYPEVFDRIAAHFNCTDAMSKVLDHPDEMQFFDRTLHAIDLLPIAFNARAGSAHDNLIALEDFIARIPESNKKKLIMDAFDFEKARFEFMSGISRSLWMENDRRRLEDYRKIFITKDMDVNSVLFEFQKNIHLVESEWRWGIYTIIDELYLLRVIYNFPLSEGYFQTLFLYDQELNRITEYDLEQFSMVMLESFRRPTSFNDAFSTMSKYFEQGEEELEVLRPFALLRLKELFFIGALGCAK
jgi:hypothetical protein